MTPLPLVPGVLKARLLFTVGSDTTVGTGLFFRYTGGAPSNSDAVSLATDILTAAAAEFPALMFTEDALTGVDVQDLSSDTSGDGEALGSHAGTLAGGTIPASAAFLVNHAISRRYRGGRPRSYFPFGAQSELQTGQTWASAFVASVTSAFDAFLASCIGATGGSTEISNHVNVSYYSGFTSVENPITHRWRNVPTLRTDPVVDLITGSVGSVRVSSQRRRLGH